MGKNGIKELIREEQQVERRRAEYERYLQSDGWKEKRERALGRAERRCQLCYSPDDLEVHHRTYERLGHERDMDLTVLCGACHGVFHELLRMRQRAAFGERHPLPARPRHLDIPDYNALGDDDDDEKGQ